MARFLLVLLGLSLFSLAAAAQGEVPCADGSEPDASEAPPEQPADQSLDPDEERARRLFLLGDDLYMQGRYDEALVAFEESYELSGRPLLLYNMANVHERTGEFDEALLKLEAYLPHSTDEERPRLRTRIESLRDRVARIEARRRREEELIARGVAPQGPPQRRVDMPALLTTLGGVALLGGGLGMALYARNEGAELEEMCAEGSGGRYCPVEAERSVKRERWASALADGLFVAGAVTMIVGIWLFARDDDDDDEEATDAAPQVDAWLGPQGGGVEVRHAF